MNLIIFTIHCIQVSRSLQIIIDSTIDSVIKLRLTINYMCTWSKVKYYWSVIASLLPYFDIVI